MNTTRIGTHLARPACAALLAIALAACGGSDDVPPAGPNASATIGIAGGTLAGPGGAQLAVPAGALAASTVLSIAQSGAGAPALPPGGLELGAMFALMPHGTAFASPATLSVPFDASLVPAGATPVLMKTNAAQNGWDVVAGAAVSGNVLQAPITGFSWVIVVVPPTLPTIAVQPAPQSVVEPNGATFAVGATGPTLSGVLGFQWRRNGVAINGANGATHDTGPTSVAGDDGAVYSVDVSNRAGTVQSSGATLTVTAAIVPPAVTQQPASATVAVGASATFSVAASGTTPVYQWRRSDDGGLNFTDIVGANATSYTVAAAAAGDDNARFLVRVSNGAGFVLSDAATLLVTAAPPAPGLLGRIAAGGRFSLAVTAAGVPHSWGNDSAGQLGNGLPNANRNTAAPLGTLSDVRWVSAGHDYPGVAVLRNGSAWAWGYRGNVDCAVGTVAAVPIQVGGAANVVAASVGADHTLLLRGDGNVLAFGCNHSGQLGRPGAAAPMSPAALVAGLPPIVAVAAGDAFSIALDATGRVWSWGRSDPGNRSGSGSSATPTLLAGLTGITAIAAGPEHALALRSDGAVLAWGSNRNGRLGDGTTIDRPAPTPTLLTAQITAIAAGGDNGLALRADGVVLSWGINETGQLGSGSGSPGFRPQPGAVTGLTDVVAIACGSGLGHSLALRRDGSVWAWGHNDAGQLGDGTNTARLVPVAVVGVNLN